MVVFAFEHILFFQLWHHFISQDFLKPHEMKNELISSDMHIMRSRRNKIRFADAMKGLAYSHLKETSFFPDEPNAIDVEHFLIHLSRFFSQRWEKIIADKLSEVWIL